MAEAPERLFRLAAQLASAQRAEQKAKEKRIGLEEELAGGSGFDLEEGQLTYDAYCPEGHCKYTVKQPLNDTLDEKAWVAMRLKLPKDHPGRGIFKTKPVLDKKAARELMKTNPKAWAEISEVITTKPGKVSVTLLECIQALPLAQDPPAAQEAS